MSRSWTMCFVGSRAAIGEGKAWRGYRAIWAILPPWLRALEVTSCLCRAEIGRRLGRQRTTPRVHVSASSILPRTIISLFRGSGLRTSLPLYQESIWRGCWPQQDRRNQHRLAAKSKIKRTETWDLVDSSLPQSNTGGQSETYDSSTSI